MIDRKNLQSIAFVLRREARHPEGRVLEPLLESIEKVAKQRLRDLPPPEWDADTKYAYEEYNRNALPENKKPLPEAKWDFARINNDHGIGHLVSFLRPHYKTAEAQGGGSRAQKRYLKWYPAAEVLLYCAKMRVHGPQQLVVDWLIDALGNMTILEESIGRKLRQKRTSKGPTGRSKEIVASMAGHMAANPRIGQKRAAELTLSVDRLGTTVAGNHKAWTRYARKLGHQA